MGYLDRPQVGDKVKTRSGLVGVIVRQAQYNDGVIIKDKDGNEHYACIQACKKVED